MDESKETTSLIAASKVNGAYVYNTAGENIGSIHDVMIDKTSGNVAYAIMSFGGFLGIGDSYHPIPWKILKYDVGKGGYLVNLDKRQLEDAPSYSSSTTPDWNDRAYEDKIDKYYGGDPSFGAKL